MSVTVFHNPRCGTSRKLLAMLAERGIEPTVVEYLKAGWTEDQLTDLLARMGGARPRDILRRRETLAQDMGLLPEDTPDDLILHAMVQHPILVERPIIETDKGAVVARPITRADPLL
ncbi:MAG: arsenate reductase (glutaredoxin) [Brevundimonas sp.]